MNPVPTIAADARGTLSDQGRARLLSRRGEPLFLAGWQRPLFVHFEVDADRLQRDVPFPLDLRGSKAYVSLVAFTMRDMRFRFGGPTLSWFLKPIASHSFLNVRTYVKHNGESGIYFVREWLSNWLSVQLGPLLYGLPYHYAKIQYQHSHENGQLTGLVESHQTGEYFKYEANCRNDAFTPAPQNSLAEFLIERYTAYTARGSTRRFFRIWHPPWPQTTADIRILDDSLLRRAWPWFAGARLVGANYSPGFSEVWMGRAHGVR